MMFRISALTVAILVASTSFATARGIVRAPPPVIVVPVEDPFDGFYAGLEFGPAFGTITVIELGDEPDDYDLDGVFVAGVFAGYNVQNGNMVYGGEVRYLHVNADPIPAFPAV